MKKLIIIIIFILFTSQSIADSVMIATDHGHPVSVGMHISEIGWIFGYKPDHPCVNKKRCLIDVSQRITGGKAHVELDIDQAGIVRDIIVTMD